MDSLRGEDVQGGDSAEVPPVLAVGAGPYGGVRITTILVVLRIFVLFNFCC